MAAANSGRAEPGTCLRTRLPMATLEALSFATSRATAAEVKRMVQSGGSVLFRLRARVPLHLRVPYVGGAVRLSWRGERRNIRIDSDPKFDGQKDQYDQDRHGPHN
jgi:hypothetical protein